MTIAATRTVRTAFLRQPNVHIDRPLDTHSDYVVAACAGDPGQYAGSRAVVRRNRSSEVCGVCVDSAGVLREAACRPSSIGAQDVADLAGCAIGWVKLFAALDERGEFFTQRSEFFDSFLDVTELGREEVGDVAAWCLAFGANGEHAGDFGERQSGCL